MIFRHLLNMRSHPTWVRGLKPRSNSSNTHASLSHPTWVRGLKRECQTASRRGTSRTLRGCVD